MGAATFAATLMLEQGIHPKIVSERLGHSDISLTLKIYSHVLPAMQDQAAEKLDQLLVPIEVSTDAWLTPAAARQLQKKGLRWQSPFSMPISRGIWGISAHIQAGGNGHRPLAGFEPLLTDPESALSVYTGSTL